MGKHKVFTENGKLLVYMEPGKYGQPDRDALPSVPVPIVVLGTAAPTITPQKVGDFFIDTTNKNTYVAQGTSSSSDWAIMDTDAAAVLAALVTTGTSAPGTAPARVGAFYIDTTAKNAYIAVGTSTSDDWVLIDTDITGVLGVIVSSGSGAPGTTPARLGLIYIDTDASEVYVSTGTASSADWTRLVPSTMASQELTVTGDINALTREVLLNHDTTPVVATKAAAPASDWMQVKNVSSGGTAAHQAVLTSGTWDGTNNIATLDEPGEGFVVLFDANGDGTVVVNTGGVVFSS